MVNLVMVRERLTQLGIPVSQEDLPALEFELNKIINYTLNYCNRDTIPEIVEPKLIDRVCGEYLFFKKNTGKLENFDYDRVIKSIKEGDTTLTYEGGKDDKTPEDRFDTFVRELTKAYDKWVTPHRKLRW